MPYVSPIDALKSKYLCFRCVGEAYLSNEMQSTGQRRRCSYCGRIGKSYALGTMAERIEQAFDQHYVRTSDQPDSMQSMMLSDRESDYEWERDGEPVVWAIANAADLPEEAAQDIQEILADQHSDFDAHAMGEETPFSDDSYYTERGTSDEIWQEEWAEFEKSLKTEARFYSRVGAAHLRSVFRGLDEMVSHDGRPLIVEAGPGTSLEAFYRARAFQSDDRLETAMARPDLHLGSPPMNFAAAGRMNAQGISVFYGASEPGTAIAEVRPPVGSKVAVARFEIIRPLKLLDLTALGAVSAGGSIFDPRLADRLERATFLSSLSARITRPVMPDDQAFEYLPTQAIADYLATENDPPLDGIVFPSVQADGDVLNVVLFHKAARVAPIGLPKGTIVEASTGQHYEDGWETDYIVTEKVPPQEPAASDTPGAEGFPFLSAGSDWWKAPDPDSREASLRVDLNSMRIHSIRRVEFETTEFAVRRLRWERSTTT